MSTTPTIVALTDLPALRAAGANYPETVDGWRWLFRRRRERGLETAFKRCGRRILIDVPAYLEALRQKSAA